jgi:hypothetical protein
MRGQALREFVDEALFKLPIELEPKQNARIILQFLKGE